jgi:hypothetical protein
MAESIQNLLRQESVTPGEVARTTPNFRSSEFSGGGLQVGNLPALPSVSSEELKYRNLAAIAGGVGQAIDTFGQIASQIDKSTLEEVQAKFNELDAEEIDPREKLRRFTEIVDSTTTIVSPNTWETNMMAEANKRFGRKALNEYAMEKFKQDASQDPNFGGDLEDEEFLGRYLPKWKTKNPTLTYTDPIKTLDGKLVSQARERDRQLFLVSLTESYRQELNLSQELIDGLKSGSIDTSDPRFSPEFVELWNASSVTNEFKDFLGFANSKVVEQLKEFPNANTLPPKQLELITKGIMKEIQEPLAKIWELRTDISVQQETQTKATTYEALFSQAVNNPSNENFMRFVATAKTNFIPRNRNEAAKFSVRVGESLWLNLEKNYPDWANKSEKEKYTIWEKQLKDTLKANWVFSDSVLSLQTGIIFALNESTTTDPQSQKGRKISIYANSNIKGSIETSTQNQSNLLITSGKTDVQSYRDVLLDTLRKYTGFDVPVDSPEMKALEQLIFDEVKDEEGNVTGFQPSSALSSEKLNAWKEKYPAEFKKLDQQGFTVTRETIDYLRESWAELSSQYQKVQGELSREKSNAGDVDPKHYSETSIRHQIVTNPGVALTRVGTFIDSLKTNSPVTPEVRNTGMAFLQMDAEAASTLEVSTFMGIVNASDSTISQLAKRFEKTEEDLKKRIQTFRQSSPEEQQIALRDMENPIAEIAFSMTQETFGNVSENPYITWNQKTSGGVAGEVVKISKNIQAELDALKEGTPEYRAKKAELNLHLAMWEYHVKTMGSLSVSPDDPVLVGIRREVFAILKEKSLPELIDQGRHAEASLVMVAARALSDQEGLQAVLGAQDQNDVKYLRIVGETLKSIPGIYSPEFMLTEHKRVLDSLFKALSTTDQEAIIAEIPKVLVDELSDRADAVITRSNISSLVIRRVFQNAPARNTSLNRTRLLAAFVSGDWSLLSKDESESVGALRDFITSNNMELGGLPVPQASDETYTFNGKKGNEALVETIIEGLKLASSTSGIETFVRSGVNFSFPNSAAPLRETERKAGWKLILGNVGPNPTRRMTFATKRNPETGLPNVVSTSRNVTPFSPDAGIQIAFNNVGLTGSNQGRGDGKASSFPTGMPQTIPFNDTFEDEVISFSFEPFSPTIGQDVFTDDGNKKTSLTLDEINDAFIDVFMEDGPNTTSSSLVDEITPEQSYIVSAISLPATKQNVLGVVSLLGIPVPNQEEFLKNLSSYQSNNPNASVLSFLSTQKFSQYFEEDVASIQYSLAHAYIFPYFEKGVNLRTTTEGSRIKQEIVIQPVGPMYFEQQNKQEFAGEVNRKKQIKVTGKSFPARQPWLDDVHTLAGQQQRARLQLTLLQLVDFNMGRERNPNLSIRSSVRGNQ